MADISRLSRLVAGVQRGVDLQSNALVVGSLKVGSATPTELTKAILDNLIALQDGTDFSDGSNAHTHDGRYYTETEMSSSGTGEGASLVGIEDASAYYAGSNVEAALDELEAQIGGLTSSTYSFGEANVLANNDALYAALNKLDLKWGDLASVANGEGASLVGLEDAAGLYAGANVEAALAEVGQDAADLRTLSGTADGAVDLGTFTGSTISDNIAIKAALQELETAHEANAAILAGWEWQESAADYIADNTIAPPTEVSGDRYVLSHDGGAPHADYDGAAAGDIVEFNGTSWIAVSPTVGMVISIDDESTSLRQWSGSAWDQKFFESTTASTGLTKSGFDIRLADAAKSNGISVSSGVISAHLGSGLVFAANDIAIDFSTAYNDVKAVSAADLASTDNGKGASIIGIEDSGALFAASNVEAALAELKNDLAAQDDASEITYTPGVLADWDGSADPGEVNDALDQLASRLTIAEAGSVALSEDIDAGETLAAGLKAVRYGVTDLDTPETAGRVYLADPTELSLVKTGGNKDPFYVVGLVLAAGETAGTAVTVYKSGVMNVPSHGFTLIGEPLFLSDAGVLSQTAPSASGEAAVKVGIIKDANNIEISVDVQGVN